MSEFEDNLWGAVVRERGDELAEATRTVREHGRTSRFQLLAGTTVSVAVAAAAATLLLGASTTSPAFAVMRHPDGRVTINLMKAAGIGGVNGKLAAMGVRARVLALAKSAPPVSCPAGTVPTITFDPASIPQRQVLMITSGQPGAPPTSAAKTGPADLSAQTRGTSSGSGENPVATSRVGSNHVVRITPAGSQIQIKTAEETNHVARMYCR